MQSCIRLAHPGFSPGQGRMAVKAVRLAMTVCFCLIAGSISEAKAQDDVAATHWAFSAFFGTGWYEIDDNRSVFIFRVPPEQQLRKPSFTPASADGPAKRQVGIELHYPLSFGLNSVHEISGIIDPGNFGSFSFTPGIELEIPLTAYWDLRPLLHAGWGKETNGGSSAWIYYGGVKSRFTPPNDLLDFSLLNALFYAGYDAGHQDSEQLASAMAGAEFRHPLPWVTAGGDRMNFDWHLTYSWLIDEAEFQLSRQISQSVSDEWEFGFALRRSGKPLNLWFMEFEHVGLALHWSTDGDYRAITVNLSSPFTD